MRTRRLVVPGRGRKVPAAPRRLAAALLVTALAPGAGGCSFALHRPPSRPLQATDDLRCTQVPAEPVADVVGAVAFFLAGSLAVGLSGACTDTCDKSKPNSGLKLTGAALLAASATEVAAAVVGFSRTAECRRVAGVQEACRDGDDVACAWLAAPEQAVPAPAGPPAVPAPLHDR